MVPFCLLLIGAVALERGLEFRRWTWEESTRFRFRDDINNALRWGTAANKAGLTRIYAEQLPRSTPNALFNLDYPPLRLWVMAKWAAWTQKNFPEARGWQNTYAFNAPLLRLNTAAALLGAVAAFFLVALWVSRGQEPLAQTVRGAGWRGKLRGWFWPAAQGRTRLSTRGMLAGMLAALLLWFNPAVLYDAHVWPQWEVWVIPFFLGAALAASFDWWLAAGVCVAVGAMLKGQMLLAAPLFVLWTIFESRFGAALRWLVGFALGAGLIVSPWILRDGASGNLQAGAIVFVVLATAAMAAVYPWPTMRKVWPWRTGGLAPLPERWAAYWTAGAAAAGLWLSVPLFGGDMSWYEVGFAYGSRHYNILHMGDTPNLASLLTERYRWENWNGPDQPMFTVEADSWWAWVFPVGPLETRRFLTALYGASMLLCSLGAAIQSRRRDARILVALAAPWVLCFALLPQMHERYLVFAAGISAVLAGLGVGMTLLHLLITVLAAAPMLPANFWPELTRYLRPAYPGTGWLLLLVAGMLLYLSLSPRRRNVVEDLKSPSSVADRDDQGT